MRIVRLNELKAIAQKYIIWSINTTITNLDYPVLAMCIFMVAILGAKLSIAVPTALAIIQLLNSLHNSSTMLPSFVSDLVDFFVSLNRIQNFLNCPELEANTIEQKSSAENSIKIENGHFFWGLDGDIKSENHSNSQSSRHHTQFVDCDSLVNTSKIYHITFVKEMQTS